MYHQAFYPPRRWDRALLIAGFYGLCAGVALAWGYAQGRSALWWHRSVEEAWITSGYVISNGILGLAVGLGLVVITRILQDRSSLVRKLHNEFHHLLASLQKQEVMVLAVSSALGEELFFRGALLSRLEICLPGAWGTALGIVGSAMLFSLVHIAPGKKFFSWTIGSFLVGLAFAGLYVGMGDLTAPVVAHAVVNWLNLRDIIQRPRVL